MKKLFRKTIITIALVCIARGSLAVTIDLPGYDFADIARSANLAPPGEGAYTFNYMSALSDITDIYATTYVYSSSTNARIDLDFGTNVFAGSGFDISIFFVGGGQQGHVFGLSLPDNPSAYPDVISFDSNSYGPYAHTGYNLSDNDNDPSNDYPIFRMDIDLDQYGLLGEAPIGTLSLDIGNRSAVPSLVAAHHLQPSAVVPIPLPIVLFGSGLALLGFIGRKNRR